ncbi:MAG: hypothetical protein U1E70_11595 [Acetobacteraceae bacterium]|nr:hypothetical protein [Pseudomonadota bacterium]
MAEYRLYLLDVQGRIVKATPADCDSDEEALRTAEAMLRSGQAIEVWQRDRRVGVVKRA